MGIKHATLPAGTDSGDGKVSKNYWAEDHVITGLDVGFIGARVYNNAAQSANSGAYTFITFNSERFDTDGFHSTTSNTGRLTVPAGLGGYYIIGASAIWSNESLAGQRLLRFTVNGSTVHRDGSSSDTQQIVTASFPRYLNAGDYVQLEQYQDSGNNSVGVAYNTNEESPEFWIYKLDAGRVGSGVGAKVNRTATQSCNNEVIQFTSEVWDTDGFHDNSTNNSRFTIPAGLSGKYLLTAIAQDQTGELTLIFNKNGANLPNGGGVAAQYKALTVTTVVDLVAGDYVEVVAYTGGNTHTIYAENPSSWQSASMTIMRLDSGPITNPTPYLDRYANPIDATMGDEFDGASLNARWSRRTITSGWETYQQGDSTWLVCDIASTTAQCQYYQTAPSGDWEFIAKMKATYSLASGSPTYMYGLGCLDSSGNGRAILLYTDGLIYLATIATYVYSTYTRVMGFSHPYLGGHPVRLRIRKSGSTIYVAHSFDGEIWSQEASVSDSSTWAEITVGRFYGTSSGTERFSIDKFDRVS